MKFIPNAITLSRIALLYPVHYFFTSGSAYTAFFVLLLLLSSDWLDGYAARRLNAVTTLGAILDPFADKVIYLSLLWMLQGYFPIFWALVLTVPAETLLVLIRLLPMKNRSIPATDIGKLKMVLQSAAVSFMFFGLAMGDPVYSADGVFLAYFSVPLSWLSLKSHFSKK
ncbi:MAG: CDP-alcohol phosphatidyltransferase family protein [Candidatus Sungbacteria bacterium]|nr:CDP-alcohol phosphatidyltransferase family protein [Candidatus Sungbacteria bacterium]